MKIKGFKDTIAWYDQNADKYARVNAVVADLDQIGEFTSLIPMNGTILDAGCAAGRDCNLMQQKGFTVTGVDISHGLLSIAHDLFPLIQFVEDNFLALPMADNSFDGIWAHQSLIHLETPADVSKALSEFHRVLKPGGILLVLVTAQTDQNKTAVVTDAFSEHDRFFQYFTKNEIESLLKQAAFSPIRIEQYGEADKNPRRRAEVELILSLSKKA